MLNVESNGSSNPLSSDRMSLTELDTIGFLILPDLGEQLVDHISGDVR